MTIHDALVSASTHGAQPTQLRARVVEYGQRDRLHRALRRFLPIFGVGCALLFVPPHVFWLIGFTATASVLALQRFRQEREILELAGRCPGCSAEQTLEPPSALPAIRRCPACGAFLKLEQV